MADYYNFQQLAQMLGISEATIVDLQKKGLLQFTVKNGRSFLSSQQTYLLRVALRRAHKDKIELVEALSKVEERWLAQSHALKN
jgi:hypothetical protein